jgi:hypothetical protein
MKDLYLLFSHRLTEAQETDARRNWSVEEIVYLPQELQPLWSNVPPDLEDLKDYLQPFESWLAESADPGDLILIQGDFGATFRMVNWSIEQGLLPLYATTRREVVEEKGPDGEVHALKVFRHARFRKYA